MAHLDRNDLFVLAASLLMSSKSTDQWGYSVESQAAHINVMLDGSDFLSTDDLYSELVKNLPSTTRARVSSHLTSLRKNPGANLEEQRVGRQVSFRVHSGLSASDSSRASFGEKSKAGETMVESVTSLATAQSTIEDESQNLVAVDLDQHLTSRVEVSVSRIVRDTVLAAQVKLKHNYCCQICGETVRLADGSGYAEGHHLQPLGSPHDGPDIAENIVCLCPNHHAACDFGAFRLELRMLRLGTGHRISERFVAYHNEVVFRG